MKNVGFVGLGFMGRGMASNLLRNIDKLIVYDISPQNIQLFEKLIEKKEKVIFANSLKEVAQETQTICLSLPDENSCNNVIFGSHGIANTWKNKQGNKLIIDHGTFSQSFAKNTSNKLLTNYNNINYMDAPVSGGPMGAKNATLTIMSGGKKELFEENKYILHSIGKNILHFGPVGSGMAAKLVNNALVSAHAQCAAEALLMSQRLGLLGEEGNNDVEKIENLFTMLKASWGQSKVLELVGDDFISYTNQNNNQLKEQQNNIQGLKHFNTQAPLRNLKKDMSCVISDLKQSFDNNPEKLEKSFPLFHETYNCINKACDSNTNDLSESPFAALLIPIHNESTLNNKNNNNNNK